ncbi:hypothetical protein GCM10023197_17570 [Gordonia humi]
MILLATVSFQATETGLSHQTPTFDAPPPSATTEFDNGADGSNSAGADWLARLRENVAVDFQFPDEHPRIANLRGETRPPFQQAWVRTAERLSDDPLSQAAGFAYASDLFLLSSVLPPHALTTDRPGLQLASLDHSVWFHAPFRSDMWHLYEQEGVWTGGGRALTRGHLFSRDGVLMASTTQEGVVRVRETTT